MATRHTLGGVIHTYQRYDPTRIPSPLQAPPDLVSGAFEHLLAYGSLRELTDEELARAVRIDPSQIAGLGPSLESLMEMLRQRKAKILATYETDTVQAEARRRYRRWGQQMHPPRVLRSRFEEAFEEEQLHELERLWYRAGDERGQFARQLVQLVDRLGDKYQIDELAAKYEFTGRVSMSIPKALEIKEELETIDRLLKQLEEAARTARVGVIDLEQLARFAEPGDVDELRQLARQIEQYIRLLAEQQGLERTAQGYQLTPKAYRLFQGRLLERIFDDLQASRTGRHSGPVVGEGAGELQQTKPYEFGDSIANMDIPGSLINAMIRDGARLPVRMKPEDIQIHRTRNTPKCATVVLLDMSGSMRYAGQYINVKRMGLALEGLIRREYPGDYLQFVEIASFAKLRHVSEVATLLPKPVTIYDPVVRLRADMSDEGITELDVPPHFTNIQHGLQMARRLLAAQDTPNRSVILITDGLPTAHFEEHFLYLLYPPHRRTEQSTLREGQLCRREGITINIFLLPTWAQSREDVQFAYRLAESTAGRVFFTAGRDLDRYVIWDYLKRRRDIVA
ncbi:MAG TPA: VWA domain-containing protein [Planctomycetaceae bacterium]|nr:VWA domain-containing protein [Planctomycetaceae bacterium]